MKTYVGGILLNSKNEFLLIKRSSEASNLPLLWSIPGGEVQENETLEQAITREYKEETGLLISIKTKFDIIERCEWMVTIFIVGKEFGIETTQFDPQTDDIAYYEYNNIPEVIVLESLLSITNYYLKFLNHKTNYTEITDNIYSSIYYTHLHNRLKEDLDDSIELKVIFDIISNTPTRKYKSGLIYLISKPNFEINNILFVLPEMMFAIWTLFDDIADKRLSRYSSKTIYASHGHKGSTVLCFLVLEKFKSFISKILESPEVKLIISEMRNCGLASLTRFSNINNYSINDYLSNSHRRSSFLGTIWKIILRTYGKEVEAEFVTQIYPKTAMLGQIINDYYDCFKLKTFNDFNERIITYPTLLLNEKIESSDISEPNTLKKIWMEQHVEHNADIESYKLLLAQHNIERTHLEEINRRLKDLSNDIGTSNLSKDKKLVFESWVDLQFGNVINSNKIDINKLVNVVTNLTFK